MPVKRVFVALGELLGVADAEPVGVGVALEDAVPLDVGEADALVDEIGVADALEVGVDTADGDDELLGAADAGGDVTGVALAVAGALLAVGVGSMVPVREVTELDEVGEALALLVEAEVEGALVAVGLALMVTVAVGEAEAVGLALKVAVGVADADRVADDEGAELVETVGEALLNPDAIGVALLDAVGVALGRGVAEVHFSGMLVTEVITPPTSDAAMTGIDAKIDNTTALTVLSATRALRFVPKTGEKDCFIPEK